ncbi:auxin response factor 3 isoform X2 [Daucus carota subsp. sativus]|uniref:auxin response factor 3 isoform X2 n=1 Tax=Daucus carota subsp. sativus TaxID=79200 RepID=UPI0007EFFEDA|nr:PREDICTED: auxin response factor 3-like isoform X2 [Daucus carota subsp. sativus]
MCRLIDLNTVNEDDDETTPYSFDSSASSSSSTPVPVNVTTSSPAVCLELWHACAGPLISLPKKGSSVVYLPQGQLEYMKDVPDAAYHLPAHVFCRVLDVKFHAEAATDEVYAQVCLIPESQIEVKWWEGKSDAQAEDEETEFVVKSMTPHMFCKNLTASDTSTHGGFSVPRRAAEDCFPPLDYKQQRPSQELVAKDLHGLEWKFRHIYRGQPRRHLLTTGWSAFVNKKKLVCGDAVLFLRGDDGELRLGIRRAGQAKSGAKFALACTLQLNDIASVVKAISTKSVFNLCYNPRSSSSNFVVPFYKFSKSLSNSFTPGMRFKMLTETEDATERRCPGLIIGISDVDPLRWPGSKWRCLMVRWDDMEVTQHNRVSPWEIELSSYVSGASGLVLHSMKRSRIGFPTQPDLPVSRGLSDFRKSLRSEKVLQGQEINSFHASFKGAHAQKHHPPDKRGWYPGSVSCDSAIGSGARSNLRNSEKSCDGVDFGESLRLNKVLQGQETYSKHPYGKCPQATLGNGDPGHMKGVQAISDGTGCPFLMPGYSTCVRPSTPLVKMSSLSVPKFHESSISDPKFGAISSLNSWEKLESNNYGSLNRRFDGRITPSSPCVIDSKFQTESRQGLASIGLPNEQKQLALLKRPLETQLSNKGSSNLLSTCENSCRLFGFPLTESSHVHKECNPNWVQSPYIQQSSHLPQRDEQFYSHSLSTTKMVGGSCTKASDIYTARDMLLDIAM